MSEPAFIQCLKDAENKGSLKFYEALPLSGVSTVGTGGEAELFVLPRSVSSFCKVLRAAYLTGQRFMVIGNASNLFFHDNGFRGAIISTKMLSGITLNENGNIVADCGVMLPKLTSFALKLKKSGFEGLCSIPGTVGGALCQNASAYGQSISDGLVGFTVYLPEKDSFETRTKENTLFSYRTSGANENGAFPISAEFSGTDEKPENILRKMSENREKRKKSQPIGEKSAGSFYKKPFFESKDATCCTSAGELIDKCGLKGTRVGGAKVSEKHANFFVNTGGALTSDFVKLSDIVCKRVFGTFGVELEKEVYFVPE